MVEVEATRGRDVWVGGNPDTINGVTVTDPNVSEVRPCALLLISNHSFTIHPPQTCINFRCG